MKSEELYIITKEQLLLLPISCNTNYNDLLLSGYSKHSSQNDIAATFLLYVLLFYIYNHPVVLCRNTTTHMAKGQWWLVSVRSESVRQQRRIICLIQPERQLDRDEPPSVCAVVRQIIVTASKL